MNKAFIKYYLFKNQILRKILTLFYINYDFPSTVSIEPTNACNLSCNFCPRRISNRSISNFDFNLLKEFTNESLKYGKRIMISLEKDGEPTLNQNLVKIITYLKKNNASKIIRFSTNGTLVNSKLSREIILSGVDEINFSVNASNEQDYLNLCGSNKFKKVYENVKYFYDLKKRMRNNTPFVKVSIISTKLKNTNEFEEIWSDCSDARIIIDYKNWKGALVETKISIKRYPCLMLWLNPAINSDGTVSMCCLDYDQKGIIGDLNTETMHDIWNGNRIRQMREMHLEGIYGELCENCNFWQFQPNLFKILKVKK